MSRPSSGVRSRPLSGVSTSSKASAGPLNVKRSNEVSYEDLLVAQYLEELRKTNNAKQG